MLRAYTTIYKSTTMNKFLPILLLAFCLTTRAQSPWQGSWSNWDTEMHTQMLQIKVVGDSIFANWYTNDDWRLHKVVLKGVLSKKGKVAKGTYLYLSDHEKGNFEWHLYQFDKNTAQYKAGLRFYFQGELGVDKYNMRAWNASKRSEDTTIIPLNDFIETFKKERPKKYTSQEMIELVKNAGFLHDYRLLTPDTAVKVTKPIELISTCKEGVFTLSGLNRYIIADFCFYKSGNQSECALYLNLCKDIIRGQLNRVTQNNKGQDVREYTVYGTINEAAITKMTVTGNYVEIDFGGTTYTADTRGVLRCKLSGYMH